jgi:hypothetical protein
MDTFSAALARAKTDYPQLFDETALVEPKEVELSVEVTDFQAPTIEELRKEVTGEVPARLLEEDVSDWREAPVEDSDDDTATRRTQVGQTAVELLAVYLPFHFYPDGHWGIRFFERAMWWYTKRLAALHGTIPTFQMLKIATYSVGRHEFLHYLVELEALDMELKTGRRIYRPYWDKVYGAVYPTPDCLEETVANVWAWDNAAIRSPRALQQVFRSEMGKTGGAYGAGAKYDAQQVRVLEDRLNAQLLQCAVQPVDAPPVWGGLPRPYVQPWTRYENVSFSMTKSLGGQLSGLLNAGPLRKTIRVFHR